MLNSFDCSREFCEECLERASIFWGGHYKGNASEELRLMFGALSWFTFSQSYPHLFERSGAQYQVLDTCWNLHSLIAGVKSKSPHGERASNLCSEYGIKPPDWLGSLVKLRNELTHEAKFSGKPLGFGANQEASEATDGLIRFNQRLLLALLGVEHAFTSSPVVLCAERPFLELRPK